MVDFDDLDLIFKVTMPLPVSKIGFLCGYHMNHLTDFYRTCIDTLFGGEDESIGFRRP